MANTTRVSLPLLAEGQSSAHIIYNQALALIDAFVFPKLKSRGTNTPPGSPTTGDMYLLGASPTGAWSGQANKVAVYITSWIFYTPQEGMIMWVEDENLQISYNGSSWDSALTAARAFGNSLIF